MGKFQFADLLGIKRILEFLFIIPPVFYLVIKFRYFRLKNIFNPLIGLIFLLCLNNFYFHANLFWIFDYIFSFIAVAVILMTPNKQILFGTKIIVFVAYIFALGALISFFILQIFPSLTLDSQLAMDENGLWTTLSSTEGKTVVTSISPIAFLGLVTQEKISVLNFEFNRLRSFTSEPSLLSLYFLIPASLGFFFKKSKWLLRSLIILFFCLLSFSGSIQICFVFSFFYFIARFFLSIRNSFVFFPLVVLFIFLGISLTLGMDLFLNFDQSLASSDATHAIAKGNSLLVRGNGIVEAVSYAINSPFGSSYLRELPLSIILSTMISAGWLGMLLFVFFYWMLVKQIDTHNELKNTFLIKVATSLIFGFSCMIFLFNDYGVLNYSGLVLLAFSFRFVKSQNFNLINIPKEIYI
jgi:hypothetical protein